MNGNSTSENDEGYKKKRGLEKTTKKPKITDKDIMMKYDNPKNQ